ncbi:Uncharacterised protein [Mycobacteroides abscessus subsp. abscessus]|uniref:hypothetical protein n=1 Tax=Mycobacteroides abscessus TaxID=36809 RepID=UPI0009A8F710|nr:hypothetical protein [Mycobacteroides abscessus]SLJ22781.1 Uncharacterised protein [Mycobacteroides abscessus subsp. abscessus]
MSNYHDIANNSAFLAGRETARAYRREGVVCTRDGGPSVCPRGLDQETVAAWLRGWRSAWE